MSPCDFERLEALLFGELPSREAARVRSHLGSCPECAAEWDALRLTRDQLGGPQRRAPERIAHLYPPIAQRLQARRSVRRQLGAMALSFASLCAVVILSNGTVIHTHATEGEEDSCARQCVDYTAEEIAALEQRFSACLIATPAPSGESL